MSLHEYGYVVERQKAVDNIQVNLTPEERGLAKEMVSFGLGAVRSEDDPSSDDNDSTDRRKRKLKSPSKGVRRVRELYWESLQLRNIKAKLDAGFWDHSANPKQKSKKWTIVKDSSCDISDRQPPRNVPSWMLKTE